MTHREKATDLCGLNRGRATTQSFSMLLDFRHVSYACLKCCKCPVGCRDKRYSHYLGWVVTLRCCRIKVTLSLKNHEWLTQKNSEFSNCLKQAWISSSCLKYLILLKRKPGKVHLNVCYGDACNGEHCHDILRYAGNYTHKTVLYARPFFISEGAQPNNIDHNLTIRIELFTHAAQQNRFLRWWENAEVSIDERYYIETGRQVIY